MHVHSAAAQTAGNVQLEKTVPFSVLLVYIANSVNAAFTSTGATDCSWARAVVGLGFPTATMLQEAAAEPTRHFSAVSVLPAVLHGSQQDYLRHFLKGF